MRPALRPSLRPTSLPALRPRSLREPIAPSEHPLLVAHRGDSAVVAEHTLAAYQSAIEAGVDALECDVRMTRDGHLVCVHDRTVNRTSDGSGVVSDLDLAALERLDFTSWRDDLPTSADQLLDNNPYLDGVAADRVEEGGGVLTLGMLLALIRDADREVKLLIETKHPTRYAGLVEKTLVQVLGRFGLAGRHGPPESLRQPPDMSSRVQVMSFASTAVRRIRMLAPDIPTVLLLGQLLPLRRDGVLPPGVSIAGPGLHVLRADPGFVQRAHRRGHPVYVWTVDEPDDVEFVRSLGVDTIITDRPRDVAAQLGR